jgi:CheY-like chemotaxis protein
MAEAKKIIIAEDDEFEQNFIRKGFESSGKFEILSISPNGHQLVGELEKLKTSDLPDVILSDINMPLMTGLEALVKVKKNPLLSKIPFILFSTSKEETTATTCYSLGADKFMVKPASLNDYESFATRVHDLIAGK